MRGALPFNMNAVSQYSVNFNLMLADSYFNVMLTPS